MGRVNVGGKKPSGNAVVADVLAGKTFSNDSGTGLVGTMVNRSIEAWHQPSQEYSVGGNGDLYFRPPEGYFNGGSWVKGVDPDFSVANIKTGINIFGLTGTFTSDATAVADNILSGKTAYVNGAKLTGTSTAKKFASGTASVSSNPLTITGLAFRPRVVLAWHQTWGYNIAVASSFMNTDWDATNSVSIGASDPASAVRTNSGFSVSASGFTMYISALGSGVKWVAFE